ncbi:hypothetical protein BJ508DRAFT_312243 [Ascobolus immersus RN42]|uniref:Uncharacterized protein n=1 Tax=Ascobolus immersus RN42 TaxID=1160509 RepID=A0A3N4HTI4_ASCIM|nr:hypothetical protein BJ508DRAFT_312243 [Ascobolus immersus RN42]
MSIRTFVPSTYSEMSYSLMEANAHISMLRAELAATRTELLAYKEKAAQAEKCAYKEKQKSKDLVDLVKLFYEDAAKVEARVICDNFLRLCGFRKNLHTFPSFRQELVKAKPFGWQLIDHLLAIRPTLNNASHNRTFVSAAALLLVGENISEEFTPTMKVAHELCVRAFQESTGYEVAAFMQIAKAFKDQTGVLPRDMFIGFDQPGNIGFSPPEMLLSSYPSPILTTYKEATPALPPPIQSPISTTLATTSSYPTFLPPTKSSLVATAPNFTPTAHIPVAAQLQSYNGFTPSPSHQPVAGYSISYQI